jgi:HEAT repeat protein
VTGGRRAASAAILAIVAVLAMPAAHAQAPDTARDVGPLVRQLKSRDWEQANAAVEALRERRDARAAVVAALIDALRTGAWDRCGGDMRDTIAAALRDLRAREAVEPLLELVRRGTPIEHECAQ